MPEPEERQPVSSVSHSDHIRDIGKSKRDEVYVLKAYSVIAFFALTLFGILHATEGNKALGYMELAFCVVLVLNLLGFRLTRNLVVARTFFLACISVVMVALVITGGTSNTGIFWLFIFPNLAFFLGGKRQGLGWMAALWVFIGAVVLSAQLSWIEIPYSLITMRQLLISMAVVTFGVYIYQNAREHALREMHAAQHDLQEYLDHMTTSNIKISLSGTIMFANKAAKEASGLGERLIGTNFLESPWWSFDQSVQRRVEAAFYRVLTGQAVNYDEKFKAVSTTGQAILTVNFSMIPILDTNKKISYVLAEARDISAEEEIDRAKSEFVAVGSRYLQGPLVTGLRLSEKLLRGDARRLSEDQRQDVRTLYRNNQHMAALISDMLLVSQLELGKLPVKPRRDNITVISQAVVNEIRAGLLAGRKLTISEDYADKIPDIPVDPTVLRIILYNLLSNAVKYTPENGHVYLRVRHIDETLHPGSKGSVQIEIQDSGVGIPRTDQKKLFTKFFHGSNRRVEQGTGMGLYIVKTLTQYVGGTIAFQSQEKVGSIFIVTLPIEGMHERGTTPHSDNLS